MARLLYVNKPRFGDQLGFCRGENSSDENRFLAGTKSGLMLLFFSVYSLLLFLCFVSSVFFSRLIAMFMGFFFVRFHVLSFVFWVNSGFLFRFFLGFFLPLALSIVGYL